MQEDRERTSMDYELEDPEDPLLRREERAAENDAGAIGGRRPDYEGDEAHRPLEEAGEGEAEGFEEAEAELIERAENPHGPSPIRDAEGWDEEEAALDAEYGEADEEHTSEDDPEDSDR